MNARRGILCPLSVHAGEQGGYRSASSYLEGGSLLAILGCDSRYSRYHRLRLPADSYHPDVNIFAYPNPGTHVKAHSHAWTLAPPHNQESPQAWRLSPQTRRSRRRTPPATPTANGHADANSDSYSYLPRQPRRHCLRQLRRPQPRPHQIRLQLLYQCRNQPRPLPLRLLHRRQPLLRPR